MVRKQLDRVGREVERVWAVRGGADPWDEAALDRLNSGLQRLLADTARQLEAWEVELDARRELQRRIVAAPPTAERVKELWWNEQQAFYADLVQRMELYFSYDDTAAVTFSLTALEMLTLVRLLVEEGVVQTATLRPVFRYLSRYARTERYSWLSYESLKKRYSMRHDDACKNVKKLLERLIRRIDGGRSAG